MVWVFLCLTYLLSIIYSRSICVFKNSRISFLCVGNIPFYLYIPHPFIYQWTCWPLLYFWCCKYCCSEHRDADIIYYVESKWGNLVKIDENTCLISMNLKKSRNLGTHKVEKVFILILNYFSCINSSNISVSEPHWEICNEKSLDQLTGKKFSKLT